MKVYFSSGFDRSLAKLLKGNAVLGAKVDWAISLLIDSAQHPSLRRHKLANSKDWSISLDLRTRIIYRQEGEEIHLLDIGSHDDVY